MPEVSHAERKRQERARYDERVKHYREKWQKLSTVTLARYLCFTEKDDPEHKALWIELGRRFGYSAKT